MHGPLVTEMNAASGFAAYKSGILKDSSKKLDLIQVAE